MVELKSCPTPWCNEPADPAYMWQGCDDKFTVICGGCQVEGPSEDTEAEAASAWNTRQDISNVLIEALGAMAECAGHTEECAYYGDPDGVCDCGYDAACAKRDDALRQAKAGEA